MQLERFDRAALSAAHARLKGQLVATPLIGGLCLPGFDVPAGLRIKPENLQPAGSIWFRGAMHHLARTLGGLKGLAIAAAPRPALAAAWAARLQRIPTRVFLTPTPVGGDVHGLRTLLRSLAVDVAVFGDADAAQRAAARARSDAGFHVMPGLEDPDYALGIATIGCELAAELPADCEVVLVSPAALADPIAAGLRAVGRPIAVDGADPAAPSASVRRAELAAALRIGVRLDCEGAGVAALDAALGDPRVACAGVVLSS